MSDSTPLMRSLDPRSELDFVPLVRSLSPVVEFDQRLLVEGFRETVRNNEPQVSSFASDSLGSRRPQRRGGAPVATAAVPRQAATAWPASRENPPRQATRDAAPLSPTSTFRDEAPDAPAAISSPGADPGVSAGAELAAALAEVLGGSLESTPGMSEIASVLFAPDVPSMAARADPRWENDEIKEPAEVVHDFDPVPDREPGEGMHATEPSPQPLSVQVVIESLEVELPPAPSAVPSRGSPAQSGTRPLTAAEASQIGPLRTALRFRMRSGLGRW